MEQTQTAGGFQRQLAELLGPKTAPECHCNQRIKLYPDPVSGRWYIAQVLTYDQPKFNPGHAWELRKDPEITTEPSWELCDEEAQEEAGEDERTWKRSYNRARANCFDLLMCNPDLDCFVTFTVDPGQADRENYNEICKKLSVWLSNRVQRRGLKYVLVPEYHKDGKSIHFHGLTNWEALELVDSGHRRRGSKVYNVRDLPLGFSTAIRIEGEDATRKVSKYIWKYMTKQNGQKIGGRFFLHGGPMEVPRYEYRNVSFEESAGYQMQPYPGAACKVISLPEKNIFFEDCENGVTKFRNSEFTVSGMSNTTL